jgi:uncharacterized phage-like protein YoqJ
MNMDKFITCCFTGHRPQKLHFQENSEECLDLKKRLRAAAVDAIERGYKYFICGGGLGIDLYAAEIIIDLKTEYPYVRLHLALPCLNHTKLWRSEQKRAFQEILRNADKIIYVSDRDYFEGCMHIRNKYMVDHANLVIAAYNGTSGGTQQTIAYAEKNYIDICLIALAQANE